MQKGALLCCQFSFLVMPNFLLFFQTFATHWDGGCRGFSVMTLRTPSRTVNACLELSITQTWYRLQFLGCLSWCFQHCWVENRHFLHTHSIGLVRSFWGSSLPVGHLMIWKKSLISAANLPISLGIFFPRSLMKMLYNTSITPLGTVVFQNIYTLKMRAMKWHVRHAILMQLDQNLDILFNSYWTRHV